MTAPARRPAVVERPRVLWAPRDLPELEPDVAEDLPRYREWVAQREAERVARARRGGTGSVGGGTTAAGAGGPAGGQRGSAELADAGGGAGEIGGPEIALLVVVDRPDPAALGQALASVTNQISAGWQVVAAVVGTPDPAAEAALAEAVAAAGPRATVVRCPAGSTEPAALAAAAAAAGAGAVCLLGQHDQLAPDAVALLSAALAGADLAYADEDRLGPGGLPAGPRLKPDWSPELLLSCPYVGRPVALRRELVAAAGGIRPVADGDWEHDLLLRVAERTDRVAHVAEVLCRRWPAAGPGADGPGADGAGAVTAALERRGVAASVVPGPVAGSWYVRRRLGRRPSVSAVVPFRDAAPLLRACVDSVTGTAGDVELELVLVDNGSVEPETLTLLDRLGERPGVTVCRDDRPFNWAALNNAAAGATNGEVLLFLNNDVEALRPGWLGALAAQALRPEVGAAGARLLYPTGRVQHAGVVLGLAGAAGHIFAGLPGDRSGYLGMAVLTRDCSAVTGACLATRRDCYDALGGFDESLGLDVNDIDYCLRARERGLHVVYEPQAELVHHESPSRGTSGNPKDQVRFLERWEGTVVGGDPFLNRHLTRARCSPGLQDDDEQERWWQWRSTLARS